MDELFATLAGESPPHLPPVNKKRKQQKPQTKEPLLQNGYPQKEEKQPQVERLLFHDAPDTEIGTSWQSTLPFKPTLRRPADDIVDLKHKFRTDNVIPCLPTKTVEPKHYVETARQMKPVRIRRVAKDIYLKEPSEPKTPENTIWSWFVSMIILILRFFGLWREEHVETKTEYVSPITSKKKEMYINDGLVREPKKTEVSDFSMVNRLQLELTKAIQKGDEKKAAKIGAELARLSKKERRNYLEIYNR